MLLKEMFSPIGAPNELEQDIDWLDDLKFYIDNDNDMLDRHFFPAVNKHKKHVGHPAVYKIYIRPLDYCVGEYCKKYNVDKPEEKFPKEKLIDLAKKIAAEQEAHLKNGDYET